MRIQNVNNNQTAFQARGYFPAEFTENDESVKITQKQLNTLTQMCEKIGTEKDIIDLDHKNFKDEDKPIIQGGDRHNCAYRFDYSKRRISGFATLKLDTFDKCVNTIKIIEEEYENGKKWSGFR